MKLPVYKLSDSKGNAEYMANTYSFRFTDNGPTATLRR